MLFMFVVVQSQIFAENLSHLTVISIVCGRFFLSFAWTQSFYRHLKLDSLQEARKTCKQLLIFTQSFTTPTGALSCACLINVYLSLSFTLIVLFFCWKARVDEIILIGV